MIIIIVERTTNNESVYTVLHTATTLQRHKLFSTTFYTSTFLFIIIVFIYVYVYVCVCVYFCIYSLSQNMPQIHYYKYRNMLKGTYFCVQLLC